MVKVSDQLLMEALQISAAAESAAWIFMKTTK